MQDYLIFPAWLRGSDVGTIQQLLADVHLSLQPIPEGYTSWAQTLLDELDGIHEETSLDQPIAHLMMLARACERGVFLPSHAHRILARRLDERGLTST